MKFKEIYKGDWIINIKVKKSIPWLVVGKYTGMVIIRRGIKVGKLTALTTRQLCDFVKIDYQKWLAKNDDIS